MDSRAVEIESKRKRLTDLFLESVSGDKFWEQAQGIVMDDYNTVGPRYVIGSFIYTRLLKLLHNPEIEEAKDINYLMQNHKPKYQLSLPEGWRVKPEKGMPKVFSNDGRLVSISTLKSFYYIMNGNGEHKIGLYFDKVPFNLHGIAFDLQSNRIIGKEAIEGIIEGVVKVSNPEAAKYYANKHKEKTLREHLADKAKKLGIRYRL